MSRWFITGTDTGVGKTVLTACLAEAGAGVVCAAKPLESGVPHGATWGDDAALLGRAAGHPPRTHTVWHTPVSPHRAARIEGRPVDLPAISDWIRALPGDTVLVEGAGGWRVPYMTALAAATGGPVLVVAANRLGVLNHTLLTVEAVLSDGFEVALVALNAAAPDTDASTASNLSDLRELLDVPVVSVPRIDPGDRAQRARAGAALWRALQ